MTRSGRGPGVEKGGVGNGLEEHRLGRTDREKYVAAVAEDA